ncbi:MAG: hypothetical protein KDA96_16430 [Planctomycetaceae bacterium]|nr:hypothetical protein [Planctomycetaceae bacterium]
MSKTPWQTRLRSVKTLHLDTKNPRLGRETTGRAPREIIQYLFDHDKALDVAESIATRGYFPNEPLLAVKEANGLVVVEGNRRLAALKALNEPGLLDGPMQGRVERFARRLSDATSVSTVPVTIAPNRRATDRQVAGRHVGTPVLAWQKENRASFILDKLQEGYTNDDLRDELGFTLADIQAARQTRAIAEMARSLDLPEEIMAKIGNPRAKILSTLERVVDSSVGKKCLHIEADPDHGIRGTTTQTAFLPGFKRLVTDVALGRQSSRTLNTTEQIEAYFKSLPRADRVAEKRGSFVPDDFTKGKSSNADPRPAPKKSAIRRGKTLSSSVIPKSFKIRHGNDRLIDIRGELVALNRVKFSNAGAVLLRVFLEQSVLDYLRRTGELQPLIDRLEIKEKRKLPFNTPTMKQLAPEIVRIAKAKLSPGESVKVEKALKYDAAAPFSISELHGFVHHSDFPSARDIQQFWDRTEPLFKLMLMDD